MSTIASPRDSSVSGRRIPNISTPTSSTRPSIDSPRQGPTTTTTTTTRSQSASPSRAPPTAASAATRRNRLREYYNLKREEAQGPGSSKAGDDVASEYSVNDQSEVQESEMDREGFDAETYVQHVLGTQSLEELLRCYSQVLSDIRALDAEKKALVYDNYSKLISATETIKKMRANMDPLNPMASTLDPAIAQIYERANVIKMDLRASLTPAQQKEADLGEEEKEKLKAMRKARDAARKVLNVPERLRELMKERREEEAKAEWEVTLKVLEKWKEKGVGGDDVQLCIDDGEAALRGEPPTKTSWINVRDRKS